MTLTVRSATVTGATTKGSALTHAEMDANWAHVIQASNQTFTPSGMGGSTRPVQTKLRERVSLEDYGGSPSNSAAQNDTAFTNAFAASNVVEIRTSGTFDFSTGLVLTSQSLLGAGEEIVTLNYTGSGVAITVLGTDDAPSRACGFRLTGTASATGGLVIGGTTPGCRRGQFENLQIKGFTGAGVYGVDVVGSLAAGGSYYNRFSKVRSDLNTNGWRVYSSDGASNGNRANANTFIDCTALSNTTDGYFSDYTDGNLLIGFSRTNNGAYGLNIDHVASVTVSGGYSELNTSGWLKKTANGTIHALGGQIVDHLTSSIVYAAGDFIAISTGVSVHQSGGLGFGGATPIQDGISGRSAADFTLALAGSPYLKLDHTNGLLLASRGIRKTVQNYTISSGAVDFSGFLFGAAAVALTESITSITMPASVDGFEISITFAQTTGSAFTVSGWPASVKLQGGSFTMTAASGKKDTLIFRYHSTYSQWIEISRNQNVG